MFNDIESGLYDMLIIVDDILDATILRKGLPSAHMVYGIPLTDIAIDDFITLGIRFFTGHRLEIYYRDIQQCPTFNDFRVLIRAKYATAFVWGVQWLKLCANNDKIELSADFCDK
ncbi:hypothetical protein Zmor_010003 [Zophobas morio]|uniref:Uncharacterized protein n=1 Tax=Zophobas morio TaxID=2755281 RepID=A0AA38MJB0_9CUCU|nr:hypothetical protein Zmor_010003 [Zophobas morio]